MPGGVGGVGKLFNIVKNDSGELPMYKPRVIGCLGPICALNRSIFRILDDPPWP